MGGNDIPENVFLLGKLTLVGRSARPWLKPSSMFPGDVPHDWLFANGRVSAVCIHGGAGTTAIALKNGLPVVVGMSEDLGLPRSKSLIRVIFIQCRSLGINLSGMLWAPYNTCRQCR